MQQQHVVASKVGSAFTAAAAAYFTAFARSPDRRGEFLPKWACHLCPLLNQQLKSACVVRMREGGGQRHGRVTSVVSWRRASAELLARSGGRAVQVVVGVGARRSKRSRKKSREAEHNNRKEGEKDSFSDCRVL